MFLPTGVAFHDEDFPRSTLQRNLESQRSLSPNFRNYSNIVIVAITSRVRKVILIKVIFATIVACTFLAPVIA